MQLRFYGNKILTPELINIFMPSIDSQLEKWKSKNDTNVVEMIVRNNT